MYATCPYCNTRKKLYQTKTGQLRFRKHYFTIPVITSMGIMPKKGTKRICGGSWLIITSEKEAQP